MFSGGLSVRSGRLLIPISRDAISVYVIETFQ